MQISVSADIARAKKSFQLKQGAIDGATARALNKTGEQTRTEARREIQQQRALPARVINRGLKLLRTNARTLTVKVIATGRPVSLKYYNPRGPRGRRKKPPRDSRGRFAGNNTAPISVEVIKGQRKIVRGAFFGPNGHVFRRKGAARTPIKALIGPSIPTAMAKRSVNQALQRKVRSVFPRLFDNELKRAMESVRA